MKRETGDTSFPIWLIGDSEPKNYFELLDVPFDSRHPARHSIWTPIVDIVQKILFVRAGLRLDFDKCYVRNAIADASLKPKPSSRTWSSGIATETRVFGDLVRHFAPCMVLTFGSFSYEFTRRSVGKVPEYAYSHWTCDRLGKEFNQSVKSLDCNHARIVPLLHATIARRNFLSNHSAFTGAKEGNYFDYVGELIANNLLARRNRIPKIVWLVPGSPNDS